jgi:hypothetical protein
MRVRRQLYVSRRDTKKVSGGNPIDSLLNLDSKPEASNGTPRRIPTWINRVSLLGVVLLTLSILLGSTAYFLYRSGQPGNPVISYPTGINDYSEISFFLPVETRGHWKASFYPNKSYSAVDGGEIHLWLNATIPPREPVVVQFSPGAAVDSLGVYSATTLGMSYVSADKPIFFTNYEHGEERGNAMKGGQTVMIDVSDSSRWRPSSGSEIQMIVDIVFRPRYQLIARENSRIYISLPQLDEPQTCDNTIGHAISVGFSFPCFVIFSPDGNFVRFVSGVPARLDFVDQSPEPYDLYTWKSQKDSWGIHASLVLIADEASDQKKLFLSGIAAGIASALFPLGLDVLIKQAFHRKTA